MATISVNKTNGTCTLTAKDQAGYVTVTAESNGVVKTQKIQITRIAVESIEIKELNSQYYTLAPASGYGYGKTLASPDVDLEFSVEITPSTASLAKDVTLSVTPSTGVQIRKVGDNYKLYISSTAKGEYTIKATADGIEGQREITILPSDIFENIKLPNVYGNPAKGHDAYYDIQDTILKQTGNLIPSYAIKINTRNINSTKYTTISNYRQSSLRYSHKIGLDYSPNINVDKVDVEFSIFGVFTSTQTIEFYNTFFGLSAEATGPIENNKDTNYQYYIQEGSKTEDCNIIGYNKPKFRFKSSKTEGSTTFNLNVYLHYYNPNETQSSVGSCSTPSARSEIYSEKDIRLDEGTITEFESYSYGFKYDFYGN
jgi:hypothetical protein